MPHRLLDQRWSFGNGRSYPLAEPSKVALMTSRIAHTLLFAVAAAITLAPQARAGYLAAFPKCHSQSVQARIVYLFNHAETRDLHDNAAIVSIEGPHERRIEAFGPSPTLRRYCTADAWMNHGKPNRPHRLYYRITAGMGLAGVGWKVEFCVPGHDDWRVYGGRCRVLK